MSGDPRRPNDVQGYEPPIPTEPTGDIMMLGGMVAALLGLVLKVGRTSVACMPRRRWHLSAWLRPAA